MKIVTLPDPILHQVCEPVQMGDHSIKKLAKQMAKEMYRTDGVGIAAPQVGILKRFCVIDCWYFEEDENGNEVGRNPIVLINPVIVESSEEKVVGSEGCLSVPGVSGDVERPGWVKVECLNEKFEKVTYEGDGLFGRCLQHEIDHLDGKTFVDRLNPMDRIKLLQDYEAAKAAGAKPGQVG